MADTVSNPVPANSFWMGGRHHCACHSGSFLARGLWRIAAADVSANVVTLLRDGPATFAAMVELMITPPRRGVETIRSDDVGGR